VLNCVIERYLTLIDPHYYTNFSVELDITLALDECRIPWCIEMVHQLRIELGMCVAFDLHPLETAVCVTLIGIVESSETDSLEIG
jgi:hypothetical protein